MRAMAQLHVDVTMRYAAADLLCEPGSPSPRGRNNGVARVWATTEWPSAAGGVSGVAEAGCTAQMAAMPASVQALQQARVQATAANVYDSEVLIAVAGMEVMQAGAREMRARLRMKN